MTATVYHLPRPSRGPILMPTINYAKLLDEEKALTNELRAEIASLTAERDAETDKVGALQIELDAALAEVEARKASWLGLALMLGTMFFLGLAIGAVA